MAERVMLATYSGNTDASGVPIDPDAKVVYEVLQNLELKVDVVNQWVFNPTSTLYMKEPDLERFDGIIYANTYGYWDFTELIASRRPALIMCADGTPAFGLGNDITDHSYREMFNIVNNTHPITNGLPLGGVDIGNAMWVDSVRIQNQNVRVLIEGESSDGALVLHQDKRYAFFGFYRLSQAGGSGDVDVLKLLKKTIRWVLR
jgi:hypothetical protein